MLIRLCGHFLDNPSHIDKLICIKGLPDDFFFRENKKHGGKELLPPWKPDVEANIPQSIRHLCDDMEITEVFPPIFKGEPPVVDHRKIIALKFEFMTEAGQTAWEKIERYLEGSVPRDQRIPKPVLVAPNQKSEFSPHEARRTVRGSLEMRPCEIPVIDLRLAAPPVATIPVNLGPEIQAIQPNPVPSSPVIPPVPPVPVTLTPIQALPVQALPVQCDQCQKELKNGKALKMHKMVVHKKEKVGV